MSDFIRARSEENKKIRMNEIMIITDQLFKDKSYHDITLTAIAKKLGWSRGNLYKYVTTKEEIFLELFLSKQEAYFKDLIETFSSDKHISNNKFTTIWTETLNAHLDFISYFGILATIIETNVPLKRLAEFKKRTYDDIIPILAILAEQFQLSLDCANNLFSTLIFHANGLNSACHLNPIVNEAIILAGLPIYNITFETDFSRFMLMCIKGYTK